MPEGFTSRGKPKDATMSSTTKRFRACENCHTLKIKCEPSSTKAGVCERCARYSLICAPAARRWQRDRIADLEQQLKSLQEKLDATSLSTLGTASVSEHSTRATSVVASTVDAEDKAAPSGGFVMPGADELSLLDAHMDHDAQVRCLDICTVGPGTFWSIAPTGGTADTTSWLAFLRQNMPITMLTIVGFAMSSTDARVSPQTQDDMRRKVVEALGQAAVGLSIPLHDHVQAALIAACWARPSVNDTNANAYQLVKLAQDLGKEIGLGQPEIQPSPAAYFFRIQGPLPLQMKQTWLASWLVSSMAALNMRRQHIFAWGPSHYQAMDAWERGGSNMAFLEMVYIVDLHAKVADKLRLCDVSTVYDINSDIVATTRAEARDRLDELSIRPLGSDPQLQFWRALAMIYVNEPVLHTATNKSLFSAPYIADKIGVTDFACPAEVTKTAEVALLALVEACHTAINLVSQLDPALILRLPSICFAPAVSYTFSVLVKCYIAVSAPGNTYGRVMSRQSLGVLEAMHKLIGVKNSLLDIDPHMHSWSTRIIGSVEWLGQWLDDYEAILSQYEARVGGQNPDAGYAQAVGILSQFGFF